MYNKNDETNDDSGLLREMDVPRFLFGDPSKCTYCGAPPHDVDHVIPRSQYQAAYQKGKRDVSGIRTYACKNCNGCLGDRYFPTFKARLEYAKENRMKKSRRFQNAASWDDEEIVRLDYTLRTYVASEQIRMRELDEEVTWQGSARFWLCIENLNTVHCLNPSHPAFKEWVADYFSGYVGESRRF